MDACSKAMVVDATYATSLEFNCVGGAKCQQSEIICPNNDYTINGFWDTPC